MLIEKTDENHAITVNEIISSLQSHGISAERKSIYDDVEMLKLFGLDILSRRSSPKGYYLASRDFELPELKLLVDAVQSSKFITEKKSRELIKKIGGLASQYEASELQRQVVVSNRIKTMNESIYYNIDKIHTGISSDKKISFKYCEWTCAKKLEPKKHGGNYVVSPFILSRNDENYYLIAHDDLKGDIRHYRVDKMLGINVLGEQRTGKELLKSFDIASYSKKTFGMFGGSERELEIQFDNDFIGVVLDRFGKDIRIKKNDNDTFTAYMKVNVSSQFYAWLAGLGKGVKLLSPAVEVEKYLLHLKGIIQEYE